MSKKREIVSLVIGFAGIMVGVLCTRFLNMVMMGLPLAVRMFTFIAAYWIIAIAPVVLVIASREKLSDLGFSKEKVGLQIILGIGLGLLMSVVLTLVPHLLGLGAYVNSGKGYTYLWQYIWEFIYCILGVGLVEEFAFRGFIYKRFKNLFGKDFLAVICSSVLFGLFHIFGGSLIQIVLTGLIGALFCFFKLKIRNCSTLSLIIAHGVYDAMIAVWAGVFLG
ncbi:MAG: CPBP family intramembrane metalloprotease [Lachnospiraceae bacterium]|nr:CPBP family intramembrane metalloprotease [Lachnospiraceae bacterium]